MTNQPLLPVKETSLRQALKPWKWVALGLFLLAVALSRWIPGPVVVVGYIIGIIVIANLLFHFLRHLKNIVFWRVRYRIIGSFVFVGLLPLLLICGIIYAAVYLLLGQLSANYLDNSLAAMEHEIAEINLEITQRLREPVTQEVLAQAAEPVFRKNLIRFPRLTATIIQLKHDRDASIICHYDPEGILKGLQTYPADRWLGGKNQFVGMILRKDSPGLLTAIYPLWFSPGYFLGVSAPLDPHVEARLKKDNDIFVTVTRVGKTTVEEKSTGITVRFGEQHAKGVDEKELESDLEKLEATRKADSRTMTSWGEVLVGLDFATGQKAPVGLAIIHVPVRVLYRVYFSGSYDLGRVVLAAIGVLGAIFLIAEIISVIIGATISRRITRSIHDMYQGTLALQKGELQHQIPVRRNDQLGLLAHSFNQMTSSITRLLEEVTEKKRLEQELEIAREVQATLFPKQLPHPRGLSLFGGCEPARVVSGDYYDFIHEDDARLHIIVGDISGKGISAALLMANLQAAMRNQISMFRSTQKSDVELSMAEVMRQLNTQIFLNSPSEKYATLFAGRYDAESRSLCYCNAGHLAPILVNNGTATRLEGGGTVLGLFQSASYQAQTLELSPGSVLAIFTDGVTEAVDDKDEEFGESRLIESLREARALDPEAIYQQVTAQVKRWQGNLKQHDDITLIVARVE